jgi:cAMP-dependent protein kinase regulator
MSHTTFRAGKVIIKEGQEGGTFYVVYDGEVKYLRNDQEVGARGQAGSYFGEIALLSNEQRQATVVATKDTECLVIDRKSFRHLLGPLEDLLRRNMDLYKKVMKR